MYVKSGLLHTFAAVSSPACSATVRDVTRFIVGRVQHWTNLTMVSGSKNQRAAPNVRGG